MTLEEARQRVRVELTEGPRFRCGTVRVVNPKKLPVAEVVRRLKHAGMILLGPDGRFLRKFAFAMPVAEISSEIKGLIHSY